MKHLLAIALLISTLANSAHARDGRGWEDDGQHRGRGRGHSDERMRPMMIPNDMHSSHRRQGAKCMNAYGDDHSGFTDCIRGGYGEYDRPRPQFMPMPTHSNDY